MSEILNYQQGGDVALPPDGFEQITNPLGPPKRSASRFDHFPADVYDLSSETHLVRFMKMLLGDAGVAQLHKRNLLARLQQTVSGINFFDLDAFYGAILGVRRRQTELLVKNPSNELLTPQEWDQARIRDGSYRSRVEQFAKAINLGSTTKGIEAVAESLLGCQCDVYESWRQDDRITQTYAGAVAASATYGAAVSSIPSYGAAAVGSLRPYNQRHIVWVFPHRQLTVEEAYSVQFSLDRIKPAGTLVVLQRPVEDSYINVPITRVDSDSEHWEIRSRVRNTLVRGTTLMFAGAQDDIVSVSPPAWGSYQGEAWTLMSDNPVVVAFETEGDVSAVDLVDPLAKDSPSQRVRVDDQEVSFGPSNAIRPIQSTMAGRSVSDGILACNPQTGWGTRSVTETKNAASRYIDTSEGDPSLPAEIYVDGMSINDLAVVITKDQAGRSAPLFWTTRLRPYTSAANEILEIRFESDSEFNHISYEVASFPQMVTVQAWAVATGQWVTVHEQSFYNSNPGGISGAIPPGSLHPYHFGNNHWTKIKTTVNPVLASRVRFVLKRHDRGVPPVGYDGKPIDYPLGLRHIDIGYRVSSLSQVPNANPATPIATTPNLLGQPVQQSIVRYEAKSAADGSETYWKCEAQPISEAVVSLYLDLSDVSGSPAVFNRLFLDPLTSGPTMNLYWSDESPESTDLASAESREAPVIPSVVQGSLTSMLTGDQGIRWPKSNPAWFDFDNTDVGFDAARAVWFAAEFYPNFASNTIPDRATLFSAGTQNDSVNFGDFSCVFRSATGVTLSAFGLSVTSNAWSWTPGQKLKVGGKWDPTTKTLSLTLTNQDGSTTTTTATTGVYTAVTKSPSYLRIGRSVGSSTSNDVGLDITLIKFAMGYGSPTLSDVMSSAGFTAYVRKPRFESDYTDFTAGTFLRFHPDYREWYSPQGHSYGWMGGHPDLWSNVAWTPIAQDFVLAKGYVRFPLVRARFLKMEFTNLSPEPFETFLAHQKAVKVFSKQITTTPSTAGRSIPNEPQPVSSSTQSNSRFSSNFSPLVFERQLDLDVQDQYRLLPAPTVGLIATDPLAASRLSTFAGYGFDLMRFQPSRVSAQFTQRSKHVYNIVVLEHTNKIGFFAGVREVTVSRSDDRTPLDTEAFVDPFYDQVNIESYTTSADPGIFYTTPSASPGPLATPQVVTSKVFTTFSPITELQFATQQTPPQQIVPDDLFRSPGLSTSTFTSVTEWHSSGDARVVWDSTRQGVLVSRDPAAVITTVEMDTPIIHPPITPVFTAKPSSLSILTPGSVGGIETPQVAVSKGGLLHIAVRLTPTVTLQGPLYIQLYGSDGTTLLAEKEVTSQANLQVESVMRYVLNSNPLLESTVTARVVQKGPYRDAWIMNALSIYDDGLMWEFSVNGGVEWVPALGVRNNYAGTVNFPNESNSLKWRCTMYRQSVGINYIDVRPWYKNKIQGG